jgi:transcriptional regulator with XRE-family HTH domain
MMATSRIAESLRAARIRLDWSREALAYHSGVSWSAIAQIESGRRKDVRLGTLSALAEALGVSVDYLIGNPGTIGQPLFEHRVLPYASDEDLLSTAVPFLAEGIDRSDALMTVMPEVRNGLIRDNLDGASSQVEFVDAADWYTSPGAALDRYRVFLKERLDAGAAWIRVVAELPLVGRSRAEIAAWTRYESIVNLAFASAPATIMCTYDTEALPRGVVADAHRAHPSIADGSLGTANPAYRDAEELLLRPAAAR